MSECVVRMEFPINCFECPMYDWNRQKLCCNAHLDLRPIPNGGVPKPDWCPIICPLPEGHGRMVDADELRREMYHEAFETDTDMQKWDSGCWIRYKMFENTIGAVPTIVPADAESPSPKLLDPLPIRGVEYVPTEVDVQTGTVTYELRERSET